jgi:hypothetical protein
MFHGWKVNVISLRRFPLLGRKFVPEKINTNKALRSASPEISHLVVIIVAVEHDTRCRKVIVKVSGAKFFSCRLFFCRHNRCNVNRTKVQGKKIEPSYWHKPSIRQKSVLATTVCEGPAHRSGVSWGSPDSALDWPQNKMINLT